MTNYEWLVKNKPELVKSILCRHLGKEKGKVGSCLDIVCGVCDFARINLRNADLGDYQKHCSDYPFCGSQAEKWLEEEHEPLYKKGDIVIDTYSKILVVTEDDCGEDVIKISRYVNDLEHHKYIIPITEIKKKIGHIEESEMKE